MANISQTIFSDAFCWTKTIVLYLNFTELPSMGPIDNKSPLVHDLIPEPVMMTSSNGNIFRVIDPLSGEFTCHRWIPLRKASDVEFWCFLWSAPEFTVEETIVRMVICDAIALIMTSPSWVMIKLWIKPVWSAIMKIVFHLLLMECVVIAWGIFLWHNERWHDKNYHIVRSLSFKNTESRKK